MQNLNKSTIPIIESVYDTLTNSEKIVADFFIKNINEEEDFSAANIAEKLHVSEASLTRFSKKCGFTGYREFTYYYKDNIPNNPLKYRKLTKKVLADYDEILTKSYSLIDEEQIEHIIKFIINAKRVYFYGIGSSGLVAQEMKSRFMRLGLYCDAFTDPDMIKMNSALLDENCVVIALSISSETPVILSAVEQAYKNDAKTVLFTANRISAFKNICDEIVSVATTKNLSFGNRITPQLPLLVIIDIFYAYLLNSDFDSRKEIFSTTLSALDDAEE